jgi:hypothetical protein
MVRMGTPGWFDRTAEDYRERFHWNQRLSRNVVEKHCDPLIGYWVECPNGLFNEALADKISLGKLPKYWIDVPFFKVRRSGYRIDMDNPSHGTIDGNILAHGKRLTIEQSLCQPLPLGRPFAQARHLPGRLEKSRGV